MKFASQFMVVVVSGSNSLISFSQLIFSLESFALLDMILHFSSWFL